VARSLQPDSPLANKEVERLQRIGMRPSPLPKYQMEWTDYAYGYLFRWRSAYPCG
jgi:hypothetical protein